jgi:chloramphenicol 3-O-phosphotransferase
MNLMILNGPTGTGKNTIAEIVAQGRDRCAIIDYDVLRNMFRKPHLTPWEGEAGHRQNVLGLEHACILAKSFLMNGYDCLILDVLSDETAGLYRELLKEYNPQLIHLLPSFEEIVRRNGTRPPRLTDEDLKMVYDGQRQLRAFDTQIDNTHLSPEEVADAVLQLMA